MTDFVCELRKRASDFYHGADEFAFYDAKLLRQAANAIEQHEAFRQEVSDAVVAHRQAYGTKEQTVRHTYLSRFIITKPDPLVDAIKACGYSTYPDKHALDLTAALAARGLEIREVGQ